ncbi:SDR family NAD(P)-dependent oxidoreductase [Allonocardiopsis opalescens]|uniref:NAD(P)-dependent dehydrogenase (Short-subunit alcohol dehydrogenase family) n=1 Tax=Allonocardiopsis opalescens TaxID=1144618 RepID=A0A2T0PV47_9ACTN|nr:SDR family NAD(P)-dependent oxidoreductase [Allonocardiopsis opalescens]PRX95402.1 NAD(P)-dependent dehydrogenase (short-subunit alcohol dehydrogenase family) [Allonocardiopsis opalescens]
MSSYRTVGTIVLTGATSGIGAAAAGLLTRRTRRLVVHGPEPEHEVKQLIADVREQGDAEVSYIQADFDELAAVDTLATQVGELTDEVDVLINNAGRPGPERRRLSADGNEATLQTNYLAAVLLTELLMPRVLRAAGRVVHVASATHASAVLPLDDINLERHPYSPTTAYARSKLAMIAHAQWLATEAPAPRPSVVSISPGVIATRLLHAMYGPVGEPIEHGARNIVQAALSADVHSGAYLDDGIPTQPSETACDPYFQRELHEVTRKLLHGG